MKDNLSPSQLRQINYQLKRENEVLKTDLIRIKLLLNSFEKYFNEINETIVSNKVFDLKNNIKVLKECQKSCFVSLKPLNENQLNHLCQPIVDTSDVSTQRQSNNLKTTSRKCNQKSTERENTHQLIAEEVSSHNSNESNDCTINPNVFSAEEVLDKDSKSTECEYQSNNGISGSVDQNSDQIENNIHSNEGLNNNSCVEKEAINETNSNKLKDLKQIRIENIRSLRTKPINSELEDNEIKTEDNSDTDCDFVVDEQQMSDTSEDEFIESNYLKTHSIHKNKSSENGKYFCDYIGCHKQFSRSDILSRHKKLHSGIQYPFDRKDCNKVFNAKRYLRKHLIIVHKAVFPKKCDKQRNSSSEEESKNGKYFCDFMGCHKSYDNKYVLNEHKNIHSGKQYACDRKDCNKVFSVKRNLRQHLITVHKKALLKRRRPDQPVQQLENGMYVCDHIGCGKQFNTKKQLYSHKRIHSSKQYSCEWKDCSKVFNVKRYLDRHMDKHKGIYRCSHEGCLFSGDSDTTLNLHQTSHSDDKHIKCLINDCNKQFKYMVLLRNHHLVAHPQEFDDIPWLQCQEKDCDFKTKLRSRLSVHTKTHTRPHVCKVCQKGFSKSEVLRSHLTTHLPEDKVSCDWPGCDRKFANKMLLKHHMNMHTQEKTYSCYWPNCDKAFTLKTSFKSHIMRHKGKGRYNCPHCDYDSTNTIRYKNHLKKHENQTN